MAAERVEIVVKLATQLDDLRKKRDRITAQIDEEIGRIEHEIEALMSGAGNSAGQVGRIPRDGIQGKLLNLLRDDARLSYEKLAQEIYGENTPQARARLRSTLYNLRRKGWIRGDGEEIEVLV